MLWLWREIRFKTKPNKTVIWKSWTYRSYTIFHPVLHEITRNANPECNFYALPDRHKWSVLMLPTHVTTCVVKQKKSDSVSSRVLTRQQQQDRRDGTGLPVCAELWFPCGYLYECVWSPVAVLSDAASSVSFGCVLLSPLSVQECERPCLWIHFHKEGIRPPQKRKINRSALHGYPDDHSKGFRYFGHCANPTSLYQISACVCVCSVWILQLSFNCLCRTHFLRDILDMLADALSSSIISLPARCEVRKWEQF